MRRQQQPEENRILKRFAVLGLFGFSPFNSLTFSALIFCVFVSPMSQATEGLSMSLGIGTASADYETPASLTGLQVEDSDNSLHLVLSYEIMDNFSVNFSWIDLGEAEVNFVASTTDSEALQQANLGNVPVLTKGDAFSFSYDIHIFQDLTLRGEAGLFDWNADISTEVNGNFLSVETDGTDLMLGLGINFLITEQVSSYLQFQRYALKPNDVDEVRVGLKYAF